MVTSIIAASPVSAATAGDAALAAFSTNCLSPFLTADMVKERIGGTDARFDFYDQAPFSDVSPSAVTQGADPREYTPGTDRRCEVSFDGDAGIAAADTAVAALDREGIRTEVSLPKTHADAAVTGTTLLAARALNPRRIAVVHTGTRPGPNGIETFLSVERLTPDASREALQ